MTSELSADSTTAGADGVSTVGTVTTAFEGAAAFGALTFGVLGAGAATGAGAGAAGLESFLAGIFYLTGVEEDDISNALVYSYLRRSCKPLAV
jgi:hypothetical protein